MWWRVVVLALLVAAVAGKGKKHRHQKPGRAVLDRLSSTTLSEVAVTSDPGGYLPAPLDVAPYSVVTANATCGENGAEEFCRDTPGKRGLVCDVCEGLDGSSSRRHPASLAVDGDPNTWWQSPIITNDEYQHVELVAALPGKMELLHVIIKSGPSPRPLAWSLEVSSTENGDDWRMVRAFGDRDHCRKLWDLRPERRRRKARGVKRTSRAEKPSCSTQFINSKPLENGEMHVGIGEGVPARRVRVSFRSAHASSRHSYYTVRELTLAARCLCHGHAKHCTVDQKNVKCDCVHGTCGAHCQRCCSGGAWHPREPCDQLTDRTDCSCGERGACSFDDTGAILCVNCTDNRAGPLCDRCLVGHYNILPDDPCKACKCDSEGSNGSCKWDRKHHRVICSCNQGFKGAQCDTCEDPTATFPNCLVEVTTVGCKCDPRGIVDPSRVCDEVCECKANVIGERCDTCAAGHFGLSASLGAGCAPCYCSHVASHCTADPSEGQDMVLPLGEAWLISDNDTSETVLPSVDDLGRPFLISYEVEGWESYYFVSTLLSGENSAAYGGALHAAVAWGVARGDSGGSASRAPDYVLLANDGTKISYGNSSYEIPGLIELKAPLVEGGWYSGSEHLSRNQFLDVLSDLKAIMIRAHFHFDQDEVRLERVDIKGAPAGAREICSCPLGYQGAQCTRCAPTHVRLARARGSAPAFECVPCACNMHAGCDSVDGPCGPCQHNTTGPHCERCLPGHYGNPVQGACKPCACPLYEASNNFSPNCALASAEGDEFVCTQCPDGYSGDHCELCDSGYWGSPSTLGGLCVPCECGGGPCHASTGRCLVCPPHSEGERCDQCQEGYWAGGGENSSCVPCACGSGALSRACDPRTGQCTCAPGWTGHACDTCAEGHGGVDEGCPPCACGTAALTRACSAATGRCECAPGAAPPHCHTCLSEHYALQSTGCFGCNCSSVGSESNVCDIRTGQCRCRAHVTGRACDTCEEGYWGLERGGCRRCECGAGAAACDPVSGLCACSVGVGGPRCDRCLSGYYGFGPTGCLPCPMCTEGRVCSPITGRCVCPARTRGPGCQHCARGYWGRAAGCRPCACGPGTVSDSCDAVTGQCRCRAGWTGRECGRCESGYFGPRCRPCGCLSAGTRGCEDGVCACDQNGQCPCKDNVVGEKCDTCLDGTFGLAASNPAGCTACFCFGRSAKCTQAEVARAALHAATPLHLKLLRGDLGTMDQDSLLAIRTSIQEATISVPRPPVPVYAELGELFLGDHVLSYGGALRFRVEEEGGEPLPPHVMTRFPLVSIYGNNIVLDYYERVAPVNGSHAVHLHESLWEVRSGRAGRGGRGSLGSAVASRGALMLALSDVRRLLLRLSTRAPLTAEPLHVLLLNVSLETAIAGLSRGAPAPGVERCLCPRGYDAASCQRPAPGFWMPPNTPRLLRVAGTILIDVESSRPCECHGRAVGCHPNTGYCVNCTNNTSGPHCERCAEGYYGTPERGCEPCPCPTRELSRATACAMAHGRLQCYCQPGYSGASCEQCAVGWRRRGAECVRCACDARGSLSPRCDARARCHCRAHAAGERCELCARSGHYLDEDGCKPCDNCTQTLLKSMEEMTKDLSRVDLTELSRIPQPFPAVREFSNNASNLNTELQHSKKILEDAKHLNHSINELEVAEHELFTLANKLKLDASRREMEAQSLSLESMSGLEEVLKQKRFIALQVAALDDFARGEKHLSAHRAIKEARHLLKTIKELSLIDYIAGATDVSDSANLQSTSVQEYNYRIEDALKRINKMQSELDEWERKAEDLPRLAEVVWSAGDIVAEMKKRVIPRLSSVRDVGLRCRLVLEDVSKISTNNLTEDTRVDILHTQNLAVSFPILLSELQNLTSSAEEKEGILYNLTPKYKEKYLDVVKKHVATLAEKAKEYKNLFAGTRAVASAGVQAARAWTEVTERVREAAAAAHAASVAATTAAKLARGQQPLLVAAETENAASDALRRRGKELIAKADELRRHLEAAQRGTDAVSVGLRALGWRERALASGAEGGAASGAGSAAVGALRLASAQAERVFASSRALYDEAAETRRRVRYQLRRNLAALQRLGDTALGAAEEHVSQIRGNTLRGREVSEALAAAAGARAREHTAAAHVLDPALRALREQVERARHAATTITVSLRSAGGCARAYAAWSAPAATRATLALSFDSAVHDGTLLYLPDRDSERYMRLSVEKGKLTLRWDVGGGEGVVTHPEPLQPTLDDADHTTYRLYIERVWGTVRMRVERSGGAALTSSNSTGSAPGAGLLRPALWWLGEAGAPLPACVHSLHADHAAIGLWAFTKQPATARCTGCTQRWFSEGRGSEGLVWLGGAGYVALRRSRRAADRRRFSLALSFRTTDADALLFLAHDHANNRSVSVWVRSCRVVFLVVYGAARLQIAAGGRHCDGRPAHVQATRVFNGLERGSLRVNGEETLGSPSPPVQSAAELPELSSSTYWVGGLPPEGENLGYDSLPLLGCIGGLMVDREGYDLLDTPARHGVEPGCAARPLRSAVLEGEGYIELASPAVRRKTTLGVSFRARAPSGVLLYRAPVLALDDNEVEDEEDDHHYLILALIKGELELKANVGKGELLLRINGTKFDDGVLHTVQLIRAHKQMEVWVDEKLVGRGTLAGGALAARPRGLYVGGAPPTSDTTSPNLSVGGFTGTIADLIVDTTWVGLETSIRRRGARLGRADGELRAAPPAEPRALHAQPDRDRDCAKMSSYTVEAGAVKFGDTPGSYATLRLGKDKDRGAKAEFSFSLQLRTFASEGVIMLLPGSKLKPKHYTALSLREGRARLVLRGRRRRDLTLAARLDDGLWHTVSVRISRGRVTLSSSGAAASARAPPHSRAARLFVGGPPPQALAPHVPHAAVRGGGLVGCVRRVSLNGRTEDLVRDARTHSAVGQCFPRVERGAYFAGDAYAEWPDGWTGGEGEGESVEIRLQFRAAAASGVLAAAAGALLELKDGLVVITSGGSRVESERRVCDGQWHAVRARLSRGAAWLALDAAPGERAPPALLPAAPEPAPRAALHVGGLPEGATELTEGRENFKGCIRDVVVGGAPRDWRSARALHNVLLDSCPVAT
ncbi:laminin subunit alpha-1 [Vanessa tameamea]|uniref:Laminin subunit alpha-1 n=1 Tax=Vanessa tameamea TaxID=334116 RepID=A0ABM4AXI3_VANTA